ncbi:MAG: flagellar hook-basal body complex protein FliE [Verrucomicrobiota bacterium]|jgi:flagellar hook-basal body complex protein FliE
MNPLSVIRAYAPALQPMPLPRVGAEAPAATIPFKELEALPSPVGSQPIGRTDGAAPTFDGLFGKLVGEVNQKQATAGAAVSGLMNGNSVSLHQAMIAMEEASVSFQLMVEVRNKLLESYQELMRMQL